MADELMEEPGEDFEIAGAEAEAVEEPAPVKSTTGESSLISRFSSLVQAPTFLQMQFRQMAGDRKYVSNDCMIVATQDTVAVNHVLRNQLLALAYQGTFDPKPFCQPQRQVGGWVDIQTERFAETMEVFLTRQAELMRLAPIFEGGCQDASTNGYAIFKVTLQHDLMRDSVGAARFGDQQEQVALWQTLKARIAAGEIQEGTDDWQRFQDVDNTLRTFFAGKIMEQIQAVPVMVPGPVMDPLTGMPQIDRATGLPVIGMVPDPQDPREMERQAIINGEEFDIFGLAQVEHYRGFKIDQILPEDFRWDWNVIRPEDFINGGWAAHRVYMSAEEIAKKWELSEEQMAKIKGAGAGGRTTGYGSVGGAKPSNVDQDPSLRNDIETPILNDRIAVWEFWDKSAFRRYAFIEGMDHFLENESPTDIGARFYPFFIVSYNRVTGQVQAISDVKLVRQLQDEVNMMRSHDRELKRAAYPVLFTRKDLLDKAAKDAYRNRYPGSVIETNNVEDVKKEMGESTTVPYDPRITDATVATAQMQQMFGLPLAVTGGGSEENLASALALAKEGMETGVTWRRVQANRVLTDIFQWMAQISVKAFGLPTVQEVAGPNAVWPQLTAEQLALRLFIEIRGGMSGQPRAAERLDLWMNFANIAASLQLPTNGVEVLRELLDAMGIRKDFSRFIGMVPPVSAPPPAAPPGGRGPDGGAPLMVDPARGAPDALDQVPNNPLPPS